jgi:hypothetical protein
LVNSLSNQKLTFSGHESFQCRQVWLKKGYDFLISANSFQSDDAVFKLGVGKNMVLSINFWMKALNLIDEQSHELTDLSHFLFSEKGADPYLEDIGSIWLLHYFLVKTNYSSIYSLVFNELRKERAVFSKKHLSAFIKRKFMENQNNNYNQNTIEKDISVFLRLYKKVDYQIVVKDFEDEFSSLMMELELISSTVDEEIKEGTNKKEKVEWYYLNGENRPNLPIAILLFSILDVFEGDQNISLKRLEIESDSPGMIYLLNKDGLYTKLKEIESSYPGITLSETAGNIVLVLPDGIDKWKILEDYYAR